MPGVSDAKIKPEVRYEIQWRWTERKQPGKQYGVSREYIKKVRTKAEVPKLLRKIKRAHEGVLITITKVARTNMHETEFFKK